MKQQTEVKKIITPEARLSFPALFEPREYNGRKRYGATLLFPKDADLKALKLAVLEAVKAELPKEYDKWLETFKTKWPDLPETIGKLKQPFLNGDGREWDGYEGTVFIRTTSTFPIGVVDRAKQEILDPEEIYAGCYVRASVNVYVYPAKDGGKPGVGIGLRNLQKLRDGEPFSGRSNAEDDFEALEESTTQADDSLDGM